MAMTKITNSQERLKELMTYYDVTQADICQKTGLPKSVVSLYVNGKRRPRIDKLDRIAKAYDIDVSWLMGYNVPMKRTKDNSDLAAVLSEMDVDTLEMLADILKRCDPSQKQEILDYAIYIANKFKG